MAKEICTEKCVTHGKWEAGSPMKLIGVRWAD